MSPCLKRKTRHRRKSSTAPIRIPSAPPARSIPIISHMLVSFHPPCLPQHLPYCSSSSHLFLEQLRRDVGGEEGEPLRNRKQTCWVCKQGCSYRWCRANRQKSLHCSSPIAAPPLGSEPPHAPHTHRWTHTHAHIHINTD